MTDTYDTAELKRLMEAGTPGPWEFWPADIDPLSTDMGKFVGKEGAPICDFGDCETYYPTEGSPPSAEDAALIVAAVNALPALLARVERLEKLVRVLIENDPDELIADGGHTVLDEWRYRAREAMEDAPCS